MLTNYFLVAWRNLVRNKLSSFINIASLAIGLGTVTWQAVQAATANPVGSLRSE